ncbi:N-formylglutamate amidohydrolase [Nostocoides sp. F2B08]|uniref:N-formylglutamate amidohydrolase n=1 Tax=Nostocoides sp. F2B08 TaxID=2653936 RepID=UPI001263078D|nr:N-formylglutamate amidohydrolase [Tetrasphaera sp. F2B08]KAB7745698.1 N-formylglutamate amidohydrolase [Tetrasphaera sp. F2B08]
METSPRPAATFSGDWSGQLVATAIHTGHDLRPEVAEQMILDEATRLREEDPHTDRIADLAPARVVVNRSRFEVDLNRLLEDAVYRTPEDCWDLEVWRSNPLEDAIVRRSQQVYASFYADLAARLDQVAARGPFVLYDVHSYNHRRNGPDAEPEPVDDNPEVNLGTGTVDRKVFQGVVDAFAESLGAQRTEGGQIDVRENVKFEGRALSWWVHERYAGRGVCLALEFKKTYMDEWTGAPDERRIAQLRQALAATHEPVLAALREIGD